MEKELQKKNPDDIYRTIERLEVELPGGKVETFFPISKEEYRGKLEEAMVNSGEKLRAYSSLSLNDLGGLISSGHTLNTESLKDLKTLFLKGYKLLGDLEKHKKDGSVCFLAAADNETILVLDADRLGSFEFEDKGSKYRIYRKDDRQNAGKKLYHWDENGNREELTEVSYSRFGELLDQIFYDLVGEASQLDLDKEEVLKKLERGRVKLSDTSVPGDVPLANYLESLELLDKFVGAQLDSDSQIEGVDRYYEQIVNFSATAFEYLKSRYAMLSSEVLYFMNAQKKPFFMEKGQYERVVRGEIPGWTTGEEQGTELGPGFYS